MESHTIFLCQNYMGNGYKLSARQFLGSFGWTIVSNYWLTVFKATIKWRLYTQMIPLIVAPKTCTHSPFSSWSGEYDDRELTILRLRLDRYWIECNVIIGCLPFTKIFREIRFESKWNTTFWVSGPMENFREQRDIWKGSPVPGGILQTEIRVPFLQSHLWYQFNSGLRGLFPVNGTDLYKW